MEQDTGRVWGTTWIGYRQAMGQDMGPGMGQDMGPGMG